MQIKLVAGSHRLLNEQGVIRSKDVKRRLEREEYFRALLRDDGSDRRRFLDEVGYVGDVELQVVELHSDPGDVFLTDLRLHVHTEASFDAKLFGVDLTIEDAYRFARGEKLRSPGGELMQLSRPLDFVAITDHAESFGMRTRCDDDDLTLVDDLNC